MEKRIITLMFVVLAMTTMTSAYDFKVDGLCYNYNSDGKSVTVTYERTKGTEKGHGYYNLSGEINIPSSVYSYSVTAIDERAFYGTSGIIAVTIPNTVTSIGEEAFRGCTGLTWANIGNSVTKISKYAFFYCTGLTSVTIPNSVTSIEQGAFYSCYSLTWLDIPNSVRTIGDAAFEFCDSLTSVTIPNSVTSIGSNAFVGTGLTEVTINSNILSNKYSSSNSLKKIFGTNVTKYIIGNSVGAIGEYVFYGCAALNEVTIGNSVRAIGANAFQNTAIWNTHPDGVFYVDNWVIGYKGDKPSGNLDLNLNTRGVAAGAFSGCTGLTSVTIPNSVISIGSGAFCGCTGLTSLTIPNSVISIGSSAFSGCTGLTSLTIPNYVTSIGSSAFYGCRGLTSVTIPNSVTSIGSNAFVGTGLKEVTINSNSILSNDYYEYSSLKNIFGGNVKKYFIGNSVTKIGNCAFYECSGLTSVSLPNTVTTIGWEAFMMCTNLTSVTIPISVTTIGDCAFSFCTNLQRIYTGINPIYVNLGYDVFNEVPKSTCVIHVKPEYVNRFKTTDQWKEFYNIFGDYTASINTVEVDASTREPVSYYDMNGVMHSTPVKGVNVVKYNDGSTEKIIMNQ